MFNFTRFLSMDVKMIAKPSEEDAGRALNKLAWAVVVLAVCVGAGVVVVALGVAGVLGGG